MNSFVQFAAEEAESGNIFTAIGVDWKMLIFQIIAFLVLVWFMGKFVYPVLIKTVDARQDKIEESVKAATQAEKKADEAKLEVDKLLKQARREASEVVATAKEEATSMLEKADAKAKERAEKTVAAAQEQIEKDVIAAKKVLHNETIDLVAMATEKVVGSAFSSKLDETVVSNAIKEAK